MSISVADKIFVAIGLSTFGGIVAWFGVAFFLAYTKMDLMMAKFENSPSVTRYKAFLHAGSWGRMAALLGVMAPLVKPEYFLREGGVDPGDLARFPTDLKRKLILLRRSLWAILVGMGCMGIMMLTGLVKSQ